MGRPSIKTKMGDSHMNENCKNPYPMDIRLERRWKRRDAMAVSFKNNSVVGATKRTAKSSETKAVLADKKNHMLEDEVDKDYEEFFDKKVLHIDLDNDEIEEDTDIGFEKDYKKFIVDEYASDVDSANDNNSVSDIEVITSYNSDIHEEFLETRDSDIDTNDDETDEDYRQFLDTYDGDTDETDEDYRQFLDTYDGDTDETDEDYRAFLDTYHGDTDETDEDYRAFLDTYDGDADETSEDYRAVLDTCDSDDETDEEYGAFLETYKGDTDETDEEYRAFLDTYDGDTDETDEDYRAFLDTYDGDTDKIDEASRAFSDTYDSGTEETDEDYQVFLNSDKIVDGDLVEDGNTSSDSDLVLIEPNPICKNTPFVYSKAYDSSWFDKEMNPENGKCLSSADRSQFRRRLMEYLQRPYDQQEYCLSLQTVNQQRQKERHIEIRKRVIKSYHTNGLNKSYLELYPDLGKAIAEFKEPHRVLFLLRGFIFWLKNLCHEGIFQPWLDESCLEALRKM